VSFGNGIPNFDDGASQDWQTQSADFLDVSGRIALRMWYTAFNGSWNNNILFESGPQTSAQGAGVLVYRMDDPFATTFLDNVPNPNSNSTGSITTRNGFTLNASSDVTLLKYNALSSQSSYLSIIFVCGGSTNSTTPISLNVTTNNGWAQDAQWTHANSAYSSAYSIVRVYSIPSVNNFEPGQMPSFVFNRTNGGGHGIVGIVFYQS
jgi:hypothetical protein